MFKRSRRVLVSVLTCICCLLPCFLSSCIAKVNVIVPKEAIGISSSDFSVDFKWSDNTISTGDVTDFYLYGDTAPTGRFCYRYEFKKQ